MRRLTATLCLTLAVLLFSATEGFALPSCPTDIRVFWTDCFGTLTFADGSKYVGEWRDDKKHGQGTYTFADGDKYVGEFRDDNFNGQGTYTFASGDKYVGDYKDGKHHGQGTYTFADGRIEEGIWKDGEFQYAQMASSSADYQKGLDAYKSGDYAIALREWKPLAEQGHASAQNNLGSMYENGKGVPQNDKTAVKWYRLAAEQGNAGAQNNLGLMYVRGLGVPQDHKTAVKWFKLAAEQGNADAQFNLGHRYYKGQGVPQDKKTAVKWFRLAAEQGDASAQKEVERLEKRIAKELKAERIAKEKQQRIEKEKQRIAREKEKQRIAREEQRRIARENEKIARENEKIARENEKIAREKQSSLNPGFRDLKPGLHRSTIAKKNLCKGTLNYKSGTICYDLDNLKFLGTFDNGGFLVKLIVDLGPIVGSVGFIDELATYLQKGETNIYLKMRNTLGKKYKLDFEYSERDRQLFNKNEKDKLYTVYEKGQVALLITRKEKEYSRDLWLYIEYRDVEPAQVFFESAKPKRAQESDF